jgi:hypothetical protein
MDAIDAVINELMDAINRCLMLSKFLSVIHHMEGPMKSIQQQELIQNKATAQFPGILSMHHLVFGIQQGGNK